ncbi:MAG: hypothetical protein P1U57_13365 [Oleibacter sp.]|nr:hypothetical protein [Thalassolituus sp.]
MLLLLLMRLTKGVPPSSLTTAMLLLIEIVLVNAIIAINGAASNPFSAILLIPVVLAFMLLPIVSALLLLTISVLAQVSQLFLMSPNAHDHASHMSGQMAANMSDSMIGHFQGMILGFVITSVLVAGVVLYFRRKIADQEQDLRQLRERQLRDEQLLAIGTAAAQFTHDIATPVQSIHWLLEEVNEQFDKRLDTDNKAPLWLPTLTAQFQRIQTHLDEWRLVADDIRVQRFYDIDSNDIWQKLILLMQVARPEANIQWQGNTSTNVAFIRTDRTLLPALISVLLNACEAAKKTEKNSVLVIGEVKNDVWLLRIINSSQILETLSLNILGKRFTDSSQGSGVGAVISNATIEKLGGNVHWQQTDDNIITTVELPLHLTELNKSPSNSIASNTKKAL